ncbi:MAG: hypothetical protein AABX51_03815 [Nanoarchaeota archaeon]
MRALAIFSILLLVSLVLFGCRDSSERYYGRPQGAQPQQQGGGAYPVGAGCGVQAPPNELGAASSLFNLVSAA